VVLKKIDANTIEETDKRNGKVMTVARMTVAKDGKTMTMTVEDKLHNSTVNWTAEKR
jgi:C4-type Zn-finger protein